MKQLLRILLSSCFIAIIAEPVLAQQYKSTGPYGGAVYSFYRNGTQILAAGSGGVYQSNDEGLAWKELNTQPSTFGCDQLYSIAASAGDMYAGSLHTGIYRSNDMGNNWTPTSNGLRIAPNSPYTDLEIAGTNVLAIRADSGLLFLSVNQGGTWSRVNSSIANAFALFLSSHKGNVYVSTPQGLFRSTNNGLNFTNINSSPADFGELVWSGDTAYVATGDGIRMSVDGGFSFTSVALAGTVVRRLAVQGNSIYAVVRNPAPIQDSVLFATNGSTVFSAAPFDPASFRFTTVNQLAATSTGVLVGSNYGLYSTANNGNSWGLSDSNYNATGVRALAVSGPYVYAGAYPMGVFRVKPDNGALAWDHSGDMSDGIEGNVQCIAAKGPYVHVGISNGYYRSTDSGVTWGIATGATGGNVTSVYALPATSEVLMIRNGNLFYSGDDGASFGQVVNSNLPLGVSQRVMKADTTVFVSSYNTLYKGNTMLSFTAVTGVSGYVTSVVYVGGMYYASTSGNGLFSSANGAVWMPAVVPAPGFLPSGINALIPDSSGTALIAGTDNGLYSNSSGFWIPAGLSNRVVLSLAMRGGKLFVGTCSGVYSIPYKAADPTGVGTIGRPLAGQLIIWPNPAAKEFSLRFQSTQNTNGLLVIRNVVGAEVFREHLSLRQGANEVQIAASQLNLAAGVYTVQVSGDALQAVGRVMLN
jgi:hypothetical protein